MGILRTFDKFKDQPSVSISFTDNKQSVPLLRSVRENQLVFQTLGNVILNLERRKQGGTTATLLLSSWPPARGKRTTRALQLPLQCFAYVACGSGDMPAQERQRCGGYRTSPRRGVRRPAPRESGAVGGDAATAAPRLLPRFKLEDDPCEDKEGGGVWEWPGPWLGRGIPTGPGEEENPRPL